MTHSRRIKNGNVRRTAMIDGLEVSAIAQLTAALSGIAPDRTGTTGGGEPAPPQDRFDPYDALAPAEPPLPELGPATYAPGANRASRRMWSAVGRKAVKASKKAEGSRAR